MSRILVHKPHAYSHQLYYCRSTRPRMGFDPGAKRTRHTYPVQKIGVSPETWGRTYLFLAISIRSDSARSELERCSVWLRPWKVSFEGNLSILCQYWKWRRMKRCEIPRWKDRIEVSFRFTATNNRASEVDLSSETMIAWSSGFGRLASTPRGSSTSKTLSVLGG